MRGILFLVLFFFMKGNRIYTYIVKDTFFVAILRDALFNVFCTDFPYHSLNAYI